MNERRNGGIPGGRQSMLGYVLTYSRLKGHTVDSFGFTADGTLISAFAVPHCEGVLYFLSFFLKRMAEDTKCREPV